MDETDGRWNKKLQKFVARPLERIDDFIFGASGSQASSEVA